MAQGSMNVRYQLQCCRQTSTLLEPSNDYQSKSSIPSVLHQQRHAPCRCAAQVTLLEYYPYRQQCSRLLASSLGDVEHTTAVASIFNVSHVLRISSPQRFN